MQPAAERLVVQSVRSAIVAVFVEGLRRRNPGVIANAAPAFVATYLPGVIERRHGVEFLPWQRVYAVASMLTHSIGMLGYYEDVGWWDHLTHVHSATLLSGLVHVVSRRRGRNPRTDVLGAVVVGGVLWELIEYAIHAAARRLGVEPVLINYGKRDTVLDIVFNLVGALVVIVTGDRLLRNFIDQRDRQKAIDRPQR